MLTNSIDRVPIAHLPTPLESLDRLSDHLGGPRIYIKRDDQTGLATGGNKARKLEYLVAEALRGRADTLITGGAIQSNHCRQTAAAAAKYGLKAVLVLNADPPEGAVTGNLLLDRILGAEIVWASGRDMEKLMQDTAKDLWHSGARPYLVPYGGSNAMGAAGYVAAWEELAQQMDERQINFDSIMFASSSGGTHAGLVVGAKATDSDTAILGISVHLERQKLAEVVTGICNSTTELLGLDLQFQPRDIAANDNYVGGGYAVIGDKEREAMQLFGRYEGIILDPVYTGKAASGMIDLIRSGGFSRDQTVLFWHTGGITGSFGFIKELEF
ncbi:MAG: D-cysteine desulfhydrase family protein [Chloroflexota bacterium]